MQFSPKQPKELRNSRSPERVRRRKKIERLEKRSEKAHERLDAARDKLPTKKVLKKERVLDEDKGKAKTRLFFEDEVKKPKTQSKLTFEADKSVRKVGDTLASGIHGKIHEVEGDNSAVEAAHKTEILVESATRQYSHHKKSSANKPFEKVSKLEHKAEMADKKLHYEKTVQEHPEMKKQRNMNRHYQKSAIKKDYAAARKAGTQTAGKATAKTGKKTGEKVAEKVKEFIAKNKVAFMWIRIGSCSPYFVCRIVQLLYGNVLVNRIGGYCVFLPQRRCCYARCRTAILSNGGRFAE